MEMSARVGVGTPCCFASFIARKPKNPPRSESGAQQKSGIATSVRPSAQFALERTALAPGEACGKGGGGANGGPPYAGVGAAKGRAGAPAPRLARQNGQTCAPG